MDLVAAGVDIVKAVAWPITVIIGYFVFKPEIKGLFARLTRLKHKDTELEFQEGVKGLGDAIASKPVSSVSDDPNAPPSLDDSSQPAKAESLDSLVGLAIKSPRIAVLNCWHWFKRNVIEVAQKFGFRTRDEQVDFQNAIAYLNRTQRLPAEVLAAIETLTPTVTRVLTDDTFSPPSKDVQEFVLYTAAVVDELRRLT